MNQRIPLLSKEEVEARLGEHAQVVSTVRQGVRWNQATSFLPSNDPIEDANASKIIQRDPNDVSGPGDFLSLPFVPTAHLPHPRPTASSPKTSRTRT